MKLRTIIGGAVVVAFVVGGYLGGIFPKLGFGPGGGGGGTGGTNSGQNALVSETARKSKAVLDDDDDPKVLHVRIDGRNFSLVKPEGDQAISLEELLKQVQFFPGDREGTRVRVSRRPSSKTTAEIQLRDALVEAGLSEDEINWQDGPRP